MSLSRLRHIWGLTNEPINSIWVRAYALHGRLPHVKRVPLHWCRNEYRILLYYAIRNFREAKAAFSVKVITRAVGVMDRHVTLIVVEVRKEPNQGGTDTARMRVVSFAPC